MAVVVDSVEDMEEMVELISCRRIQGEGEEEVPAEEMVQAEALLQSTLKVAGY